MNKTLNILLYLLLFVGVFVSGGLSYNELLHEGTCPKIGFLPACYLVFLCFAIPLIAHFFKKWNILFFTLTGIAFALAIFASIGQFLDKIQCPKTTVGLPKCYLSFVLLFAIIGVKYFQVKKIK